METTYRRPAGAPKDMNEPTALSVWVEREDMRRLKGLAIAQGHDNLSRYVRALIQRELDRVSG